jgi:hypothetical protein
MLSRNNTSSSVLWLVFLTTILLIWNKARSTVNTAPTTITTTTLPNASIKTFEIKFNVFGKQMGCTEYRTDWIYAILRFDSSKPKGTIEHTTDNLEEASQYMVALRAQAELRDSSFNRLGSKFELFERVSI